MRFPKGRWDAAAAAALKRGLLGGGLLLAVALGGCSKRETAVARGTREQVLHLGNKAEPADLDPHTNLGVPEGKILSAIYEGLTALDPNDLHPIPAQAKRWETSADGLTWRFFLREDAKWSNGDPIRARDWVRSIERLITPTVAAQFSHNAFYIKNAEEFQTGKITDFTQVGVKEIDPLTLEFTLKNPTPLFASVLTVWVFYPVHLPTLEKFGGDKRPNTPWSRPGSIVSNGPFMLKEWKANQFISVGPSPTYWDHAKIRLKEIRFYPTESEETEERMFRAGQLHATFEVPLGKLDVYRANEPKLLRITPYYGIYYFTINTRKPPLSDPRVRRALAIAMDRRSICENVARGGQLPAETFVPTGIGGYPGGVKIEGTLDDARRLLAEAGFPGGKGFPKLDLLYNKSDQHGAICEAVQQMWKRELGIEVELLNQEWKVYLNSLRTGDYQVARAGWIGFFPDPHEFQQSWRSTAGNNYGGFANEEYDRVLAESERAPGDAVRFPIVQKLDAIFVREMPAIPLFYYTRTLLIRPEVKGWPGNALDVRRYKEMWLEP